MADMLSTETNPLAVETLTDAEAEQQKVSLHALLLTVEHFFGGFPRCSSPSPIPASLLSSPTRCRWCWRRTHVFDAPGRAASSAALVAG